MIQDANINFKNAFKLKSKNSKIKIKNYPFFYFLLLNFDLIRR